jgi:broad specificity phosphatase PhoE
MEVLLIRHGVTDGNIAHRHQARKTPLTPLGREQAARVAKHVQVFKPTHLITSRMIRALQTAQIIGEAVDITPETSSHFVELMRSDSMYGRRLYSVHSLWFYVRWYWLPFAVKEEGAESYRDFRARLATAREYIESLPADARVVVVTHSAFISFFVAHLCQRRALGPWGMLKVFKRLIDMPNTGITKLRYEQGRGRCGWRRVDEKT